jgi:hypothetical protein
MSIVAAQSLRQTIQRLILAVTAIVIKDKVIINR